MRRDYRWLILFATSALLWLILGEVNHVLAGWNLWLYGGGLLLTYGILHFPRRSGLTHSLFLGLWVDAASPQPFGLSMVLFVLAHLIFFRLKQKFPPEETYTQVSFALLVNAFLFFLLTLWHLPGVLQVSTFAMKAATDFLLSQIMVLVIASWFFALQTEVLHRFGIFLETEQRPVE